jgi:hypothetical protein
MGGYSHLAPRTSKRVPGAELRPQRTHVGAPPHAAPATSPKPFSNLSPMQMLSELGVTFRIELKKSANKVQSV